MTELKTLPPPDYLRAIPPDTTRHADGLPNNCTLCPFHTMTKKRDGSLRHDCKVYEAKRHGSGKEIRPANRTECLTYRLYLAREKFAHAPKAI